GLVVLPGPGWPGSPMIGRLRAHKALRSITDAAESTGDARKESRAILMYSLRRQCNSCLRGT
ncbi:unnamed protein product, partial [Scytosiphon promiscuus]